MICSFAEFDVDQQSQAGGKGSVLARLFQRRYPVPDGFIIFPGAFDGDELKPDVWEQAKSQLARLRRKPNQSFAVRSSALSEDSLQASFAGEFETVLDVQTAEDIRKAIRTVRASRHAERVQVYSQAQGFDKQAHEVAVVVQKFVHAEFAGVLFTADPLTGNLMQMTGNWVRGSGEKLVSGVVNAQAFNFDRSNGKFSGASELRPYAKELYRLAARLDHELGCPQDIEWAVAKGRVTILQARPISSLREFNPLTGELNSSLSGDFLWSNGNAAEIQPEVMTLLTWSVGKLWGDGYTRWWSRIPMSGNIGGRNYFNISIQVAPFASLPGVGLKKAMSYVGVWWGRIPEGITVPLIPFSASEVLFKVVPLFFDSARRNIKLRTQIPDFVTQTPSWCRAMRQKIPTITECAALAALWREELKPYYCFGTTMASVANANSQLALQAGLTKLVGEADADALVSNMGGDGYLASLGPVVNLAKVARGEMSREAYLEQFGHRGPNEFELARPQPIDDPAWLERQLADFVQAPVDVEALLEKQRVHYKAAWERFCAKYPQKVKKMQAQLAEAARLARQREAARSEVTRVMGVLRQFALRAGELIDLGEDVFYLTIDELLAALGGDESTRRYLPARKETYARYCALPSYPPVISGRFDPFQWATDPNRRTDVFDAHISLPLPDTNVITGFPGSAGIVEGTVRRIDRAEDSHLLKPGEILVTTTTNIGWTPIFPRAAAVVTDVGAPLSHAAIVARELGIPAVVGCNDATMRLKTGDRVRVDGGKGRVEIL